MKRSPPARLWVLLASRTPVGVIFRRGPAKQVLLIKWNTRTDSFEYGQWFKGRVYEHQCDLSPAGDLLIYRAAKQKPPLYRWTAISRPPYFTALALWREGGGGWFVDDRILHLKVHPQAELHPDFRPGPITIVRGEQSTVWDFVRRRDGWTKTAKEPGEFERWRKSHPKAKLLLQISVAGGGLNYRVLASERVVLDLGRADWADWDHRGHLVLAKGGCLFRHRFARSLSPAGAQIADFNALAFRELSPPPQARHWPRARSRTK
jgi:hypothetical protein